MGLLKMEEPKAIHVVYAKWCPHCVPVTVELLKKRAEQLGVPCILHDIDTDDVRVADELVRRYGDWTPDYLVPQVFIEYRTGRIEHVLTGNPRGVSLTERSVQELVSNGPLGDAAKAVPK